jgi:hypothetical protein
MLASDAASRSADSRFDHVWSHAAADARSSGQLASSSYQGAISSHVASANISGVTDAMFVANCHLFQGETN